ncbi:phosphatidylinositol N-acetylglucosaminyltransferase subunit P-like isoform X1 [Iris pallida]|uniref:Phosphatidylinositol N-acetylglucosaminyltransferase subunit P-like isoform X1 n=1 Tax=Iris pallida TaxID=29817 RepID=A0AAX6G0I2_IRIPA|nr:phosphatidylinositol N-acetylglucosaminyltransferase subunit P-like isoform X1 [Iris pallida]KAJ6822130.1 phosphatidylinositol N-acetylglucosaminyltransferase subunit P-like isoform X1 [Iris pallida]KAJ6843267.1 phosphatidylinositol N-acetylglucosaminyltransferase subunit P-like isoform X1 [Iris pallida]
MDEWPSSPTSLALNSPRRTLSLLRERRGGRAHVTISDPGSPAAVGPKSGEVYGFVGSITTVIATVVYLVWAYTPEPWLHALGITYYPSKYWAIAIPAFPMVTVVLGLVFYLGLNFMITPPPTSYNTMFDEYSRESSSIISSEVGGEKPIEPISDIGIDKINDLMFG